jgi:tRNA(adenine34) deaminase
MNADHLKYMQAALDEAQEAYRTGEIPVGAVVVCNGKIIAAAHNLTESLNDVTAHAEMLAVTSAADYLGGKYLAGCTLYVTVEPCVMCAGALYWAQIEKIVYGAGDEKRGFTHTAPAALHPKTKVTSGVLSKECSELMIRFFKQKRQGVLV